MIHHKSHAGAPAGNDFMTENCFCEFFKKYIFYPAATQISLKD